MTSGQSAKSRQPTYHTRYTIPKTALGLAAEATSRLPMALASVAEELGAAITRGRLAFPAPEAPDPAQTWPLTVDLGAGPAAPPTIPPGAHLSLQVDFAF